MLCVVLSVAGAMLCSFIVAVFYAACVAASRADEVADELYEKRRKELEAQRDKEDERWKL